MRCDTIGGYDTVSGCYTACDFLRCNTAGSFLLYDTAAAGGHDTAGAGGFGTVDASSCDLLR